MYNLTDLPAPAWGPTGETVFTRTYSRAKPDGSKETWGETVERVVIGNLGLVYGPPETWTADVETEAEELFDAIYNFRIIPAGRHLWATGVSSRQYLSNCFVSGWGPLFSDHFSFTFLRLMEGGGVGASYNSEHVQQYGAPLRRLRLHVVADQDHQDYDLMRSDGLLSDEFSEEWPGAFQIEDSREGWAEALVDLIDTYFADEVKHADRVYNVSLVRPKGARLHTFGGTASGPHPLARMLHRVVEVLNDAHDRGFITPLDAMDIDHAIGECVVAGGVRRSARMSILRWDDPAIFDFINCKADTGRHWTTNISVEVDEGFFDALSLADEEVMDWNGNIVYRHVSQARRVHQAVVAGMMENGEPGYWNSTLSNEGEVGTVQATNPCGEIALEPWENCNLGHVNLEAFAHASPKAVAEAHRLMTRFLIRATFHDVTDERQREVMHRNRRIGVGHLGVQGFLALNGIRYSDAPGSLLFMEFLDAWREAVRDEARSYAFDLRIPEPVKVTTVAPTGSVAKLPGATEGIHPVYARYFLRRIRFSMLREEEVAQVAAFQRQGYVVEPCLYAANTMVVTIPTKERLVAEVEARGLPASVVEDASEVPLEAMLRFQAMYQQHYADNAVSFTINVPEGRYSVEEVAEALESYLPVLKGTTVMVDGTRPQAPYERLTRAEFDEWAQFVAAASDDSYDEACASGACPIR